ncbi:bifunctional DNA-formamidopyrimidine glycosylase/DNA-(apurinic or apyrimidinic site) lyase [Symbiobacterium terraclitae]|uniref:bifunctional DNA-formamidopyrimidine glycosylase/DNA-(apurinic or apyrimidinic site) lyase n=1 Tax=Symbiobacterium terraclitae TaxID=557451 RepID=UPI0035B514D5
MPELPEVETVRRTLYPRVVGRRIERVEVLTRRQIYYPDADTFVAELEGATFTDIGRRGKYLLFSLGPALLVAHLRMSGHLYVTEPGRSRTKHLHVVFHLDDGMELRYDDQRKFGGFHLLGPDRQGMPPGLANLGPEPLSDEFTPEALAAALAGRRTPVKAALLNQALVAGLGNIYADEALFCARIHPARQAASLAPDEVVRLHGCIRRVLTAAVEKRGTTFSLYRDGEGNEGDMYDELQVFDRTGQPCPICATPIVKVVVAQRGTHFCPRCQPAPEGVALKPRRARPGRRGNSVRVAAEPPERKPGARGLGAPGARW